MSADLDKVKKIARDLREVGYNGIPILPNGAKYDAYDEPTDHSYTFVETIADGKKAKGLGGWSKWNEEKQTNENCPIDKMFDNAYEKVKNKDEIKTLNYAIIHGNVSRRSMFTGEYDEKQQPIHKPAGSCALECDGHGVDLLMETILQSDMRHKLLNSPRVKTPSGGLHLLLRYFIEKRKGEEINLKSESVFQGEGHNEILLQATGKYTIVPPSEGYVWEKSDFNDIAALTMNELNDFINRLRRTDKRETKGALWTDVEQNQDISNNKEVEYDLIGIGKTLKTLYEKATKINRRHTLALHYCGILKRYIKLSKEDAFKIIESFQPGDEKNREVVDTTYKKKENEITNITTFRKIVIELVGEDAANEIICELMQHSIPEREFWSDKPDGMLLALAVDKVEECFFDQDKRAYAIVKDKKNDSYQIIKLRSEEFRLNLSLWFVDNNSGYEVARNDHKTEVVNTLTSLITRKPITLENRSVFKGDENTLYYNLNNELGQIWRITPDKDGKGVSVIKQTPDLILFRKLPDNHKQMTPAPLEELEDDKDYLDDLCTGIKSESQKIVFKCWQIALFFNSVSYAAPCACGGERLGKSTALKRAKSYYDPVEDLNNPIAKKRADTLAHELKTDRYKLDDFNLMVWRSSLIVFDNISHFTPELEDEACLWITGGTHSKRKLYDDTEMIELSGSRALAYTGINNPATRPDHIARTFNIDSDIDQDKKKTDDEIWTTHYNDKPKVLTYIGKIISKVLANYEEMKKTIKAGKVLPDFELLCEVISRCMGNPDNAFADAWAEIRDEQVSQGLESSMVAVVLENWISENYTPNYIEKTEHRLEQKPLDMYKEQKEHGIRKGLVKKEGDHQFPDSVEGYTKELYRLIGSFKHIGVEIIKPKRSAKGRRIIVKYDDFKERGTLQPDNKACDKGESHEAKITEI